MTVPKANPPSPAGAAVPAPPPGLPPELVNHARYRVLRELGRGGMGIVYQARQTVMDRQVVIKVINKVLLDRPDSLERFRREVRAAAKLAHPNIVTAYDAEQAGDLHMLVMEFVPGRSLAEALRKDGPLPVAQACAHARQAALGLQHAHERGMVHRDIKPGNLMLTPHGQVKILDFGLAKLASEQGSGTGLTASNAYMGTPEYSAPEQATDARTADIRADLYSLGCTLYCLLAGRPPFREPTPVLTILAHLQQEPRPLPEVRPDVPPALWVVVARLLAKDPARRYQTPAEAASVLAPFCKAGAKASPAPAGGQPRPAPPATLGPQATLQASAPRAPANTAPAEPPLAHLVTETEQPPPRPAAAGLWDRRWLLGGVAAGLVAALGLAVCLVAALVVGASHFLPWAGQQAARATGEPAPVAPPPAEQPPPQQQPALQPGKAPPAGPGPGKGVADQPKPVHRWKVNFPTARNDEDYLRQLRGLRPGGGAILAVPVGGERYEVFRDLSQRPAVGKVEDPASIKQYVALWEQNPVKLVGLARALGINTPPAIVVLFPPELEAEMAALEREKLGNGRVDEILETLFDVVPAANGYQARCRSVQLRRGTRVVHRTRNGERELEISLDGGADISSNGNVTLVRLPAGTLILEKGTVRLDQEELAKLPEGVRKVEVDYSAGKLTIIADGKAVLSKEIRPPG
jgi:tRNA A-37 threonylcarbamoyl transferase component Bud32